MHRTILRSARTRLVVIALVGLGFVFASAACGEETEPTSELGVATR